MLSVVLADIFACNIFQSKQMDVGSMEIHLHTYTLTFLVLGPTVLYEASDSHSSLLHTYEYIYTCTEN
jgi:hypothetical protein